MFQVSWKHRSLVVAGTVALALILAGCGGAGAGGGGAAGGNPGSGTPADTTPPAPVTALSTAAGDGSVTLSWSDPSDGDLAEILITWEPGGAAAQSVAPGNGSYTATGLSNGTAYTFTVVAVDASGNVSSGVEATATPQAPNLNAPAEVSSLQASPGDGQVTLTWSDPGDSDLDRIEIRWNPGGSTWQSVSAGTESYTATGLTNGQSYTFTLRTVDDAGNASAGVTITAETPFTGNLLTEFDQLGVEFRDYDSDSGWAVVINILGDQPDIASLMPAADPSLGTLSGVRFVSFVIRKSGLTQELPTGTFPVTPDNDAPGNAFSANFVVDLSLDFANDAYLGSDHDGSTSQDPFWTGQSWDYEIEGGQLDISRSGSTYTLDFSFDLDTGNTVTGSFTGPVDLLLQADPPDLTPPDAPTISGVSNGTLTRNNVTFSVGNVESGASVEYSVSGGSSWSTYSGPVTLSSHGAYQITARQTDEAGNTSDNATPVNVTIDKQGPGPVSGLTATASIGEIELAWNDPNDSDLADIAISWTPADAGGTAAVEDGVEGYTRDGLKAREEYQFTVRPKDSLGNLGPSRTVVATVLHPRDVYFPGMDFFPLGDNADASLTGGADKYFDVQRSLETFIALLDAPLEHWAPDSPSSYTFVVEGQTWSVEWEYEYNFGGDTHYGGGSTWIQRWCWELSSGSQGYRVCITDTTIENLPAWHFAFFSASSQQSPTLTMIFVKEAIGGEGWLQLPSDESYEFEWAWLTDGQSQYRSIMRYFVKSEVQDAIQLYEMSQDGSSGRWYWENTENQTAQGAW